MGRGLGPKARPSHRLRPTIDDVVVKRVLDERPSVRRAEYARGVGLVLGQEDRRFGITWSGTKGHPEQAQGRVVAPNDAVLQELDGGLRPAALMLTAPDPGVTEPQGRKQVQCRGDGPAIHGRQPDQQIVRRVFRVLRRNVEVPSFVKDARVGQFKLRIVLAAPGGLADESVIRECGMRVFVEGFAVRIGGCGIEGSSSTP